MTAGLTHASPSRLRVMTGSAWLVATWQGVPGLTQVRQAASGTRLEVGDAAVPGSARTQVLLREDGGVFVRASVTPPALFVTTSTARTVPAVPGVPERVQLDVGDRLLLLSADALDALPESLAQVLAELPAQVGSRSPVELLRSLFGFPPVGSGAVAMRTRKTFHLGKSTGSAEEATWVSARHS
jgi:hypothetical protein